MRHTTSTLLLAAGLSFAGLSAIAGENEDTGHDASRNAGQNAGQDTSQDEGQHWGQHDEGTSSDSRELAQDDDTSGDSEELFTESWASEHDVGQFAKALRMTGLDSSLREGEYTIFAPTDEAFDELDEAKFNKLIESEDTTALLEIVRRHIVADHVNADDATNLKAVMVLTGGTQPLSNSEEKVSIGDATVVESDIELAGADNLVVHTIDSVLGEGDQQLSVSDSGAADAGAADAAATDPGAADPGVADPGATDDMGTDDRSDDMRASDTASVDTGRSDSTRTSASNPADVVDLEEFDRLDRDGDGYLSQSEIAAEVEVQQARDSLDVDADGRVSRSEFAAMELRNPQPSSQTESQDGETQILDGKPTTRDDSYKSDAGENDY